MHIALAEPFALSTVVVAHVVKEAYRSRMQAKCVPSQPKGEPEVPIYLVAVPVALLCCSLLPLPLSTAIARIFPRVKQPSECFLRPAPFPDQ